MRPGAQPGYCGDYKDCDCNGSMDPYTTGCGNIVTCENFASSSFCTDLCEMYRFMKNCCLTVGSQNGNECGFCKVKSYENNAIVYQDCGGVNDIYGKEKCINSGALNESCKCSSGLCVDCGLCTQKIEQFMSNLSCSL